MRLIQACSKPLIMIDCNSYEIVCTQGSHMHYHNKKINYYAYCQLKFLVHIEWPR